jgi:cytochrome c oxidase cbb3-type subunit I/II
MRVGQKYPNAWHYRHMEDPRSMSPGSIMPSYPWLLTNQLDTTTTAAKIRAMQALGVPYPLPYSAMANFDLAKQAQVISDDLKQGSIDCPPDREIVALIAYLQRMGTDIKGASGGTAAGGP